ncbi:conserved hypothetical protein [Ricinus communis]|uniref:DUF4283 domain-containing protein n=1 Tax=Ricinus communis TaxID=3988 RepID=B9STS8_RICCO|nr:conserved hypothetical protein [Ricinus communis]
MTIWKLRGHYKVIDLDNGFFLIKLALKEDLEHIILDGPWTILGHYLTVQEWILKFWATNAVVSSMMSWVRLPKMSMQY